MKVINCEQGELDWMKVRLGKVTASEFGNLVTPDFKIRTGEMARTYMYQKLAEQWRGEPLPGFSNFATEQGEMREMDAFNWYSLEYDEDLRRVGFCLADDGRSGCSPDALIGEEGGCEIKCPQTVNHLKWLLEGGLPKEHAPQVYFSLWVTRRSWWRFISYHSRFPKLVVTVRPDEKIEKQIEGALAGFYLAFDQAWEKLTQLKNAA